MSQFTGTGFGPLFSPKVAAIEADCANGANHSRDSQDDRVPVGWVSMRCPDRPFILITHTVGAYWILSAY